MSTTRKQIEAILDAQQFAGLKGLVESPELECKGQLYALQTDKGKRELAKDIAAFANAEGGILLIGVKTQKSEVHRGDEIIELSPFAQSLIDVDQYLATAGSWIFPSITGLSCRWLEVLSNPVEPKGIVVITVLPQAEASRPFLLTKTVDEKKVGETLFGYVRRMGSFNQPLGAKDFQRFLALGMSYENRVAQRFDTLEAMITGLSQVPPDGGETLKLTSDVIDDRVKQAIAAALFENDRTLVLSAFPLSNGELATFLKAGRAGVRSDFENPPLIREMGWDMKTSPPSQVVEGKFLRGVDRTAKELRLYRDGFLVLVASAEPNYLGWGRDDKPILNSAALTEIVLSFLMLFEKVLKDLHQPALQFTVHVELRNMRKDELATLLSGYSVQHPFSLGAKSAPGDSFEGDFTFDTMTSGVAAKAFEILREIYFWFGFSEDKVAYQKTTATGTVIDIDTVKNLGS